MLDLYTAATPNGKKVPIALAELGLPYELHVIDFSKKEQKSAAYLAINPNGKIPALVDSEGENGERVVLFESGAILQYLAERAGKLLGKGAAGRAEVMSWLFWQVGGPGPMFGQAGAFGREQPPNRPAYEKFLNESKRLATVLDDRLEHRHYIAGDYSIADIACYPWFEGITKFEPSILEGLPHVEGWMHRMASRPAVQKGMRLGRSE
ncbi:MAG: gst [Myxococcaceae bacterium]|nr:gst [Myxococcaceae bacterium]MEA2746853.1 GSH-dependent disulfide-bond oxidoreductase [Myxococcales bacterium]